MQAYRQSSSYCDDGSQQQMHRPSSMLSSQAHHSSSHGGMQHQQYSMRQGMMHQSQHGGLVQQSQHGGLVQQSQHAGGMIHSSSSMKSQYSSSQAMTVFGQDAFCEIMPSAFPPGTDPKVIECFNRIDRDGNGIIDDRELQSVLTNCNHNFNLRTVHLLMYEFTHSNRRMIGPKEFVPLLKCLQTWRAMFQRFDRDRNGSIDSSEMNQAMSSLGYCVSPIIVNLLVAKFSKSGRCSLQYDAFIECCLTIKGLTETFNAKAVCGKATFCYEEFLLNVLPFIIA
ncbi:probable calcium-binding protein CML49 [Chenopodium quinoa]|uniref:probable calcium-binding protein CML49 n=1 Tax=Chenopodium quinoa TaxID=63459 RepID=UPI000B796EDF|nr:probable calcium-binding protein CML49 [Chenopodium quinoa]